MSSATRPRRRDTSSSVGPRGVYSHAGSSSSPGSGPATLQQVTLKALGMYCEEECPLKVRYALADIPAVYELGFDVANEAIFVSYDKSLGTPKDVTAPMLEAIKDAGFDPWLSKESWPDGVNAKIVER